MRTISRKTGRKLNDYEVIHNTLTTTDGEILTWETVEIEIKYQISLKDLDTINENLFEQGNIDDEPTTEEEKLSNVEVILYGEVDHEYCGLL